MKMYSERNMSKGNAKKHNQGGMKMKGEMGYEGKVEHMKTTAPADMSKMKPSGMDKKGYDKKAWEYKY